MNTMNHELEMGDVAAGNDGIRSAALRPPNGAAGQCRRDNSSPPVGRSLRRFEGRAPTVEGAFAPLFPRPNLDNANALVRRRSALTSVLACMAMLAAAPALVQGAETAPVGTNAPSLDPHLEPIRPLLNKTWRGPFKSSRPEKPVVDVMRAERALNGRAIRSLHSINDGSYGGETIFMWNEVKQVVTFHYFTTAGFMTTGTVRFEDGKWLTHEIVSGNADGATEVKAVSEFRPDGSFVVKAEYLKNGNWVPGRETVYREDAAAKVVFR